MAFTQIPARQVDLTNLDHIKTIIQEIEGDQNKKRRQEAWIANQCFRGNQKEYVKDRILELYPETGHKFRVGNINITKKVVSKLAAAYDTSPLRRADNDKDSALLNEMYKQYQFDKAFSEFDEVINLHKYGYLWLTWQNPEERGEEEGIYVAHALSPYEFDLVRDQVTGEPVIFILNYPDTEVTRQAGGSDGIEQTISESQSDSSADTRIYAMWSRDNFVMAESTRAKGAVTEDMKVRKLKEGTNDLGRLPGAYLQVEEAIDYPIASNLADLSVNWNVSFSDYKTAAVTQGHGQLVIKHDEGQKLKSMHMGMFTSINLPQSRKPDSKPTEANYISANPDLSGQLDGLKFEMFNILDDWNIKAKGAIEGGAEKFASALDRIVNEADVTKEVEANQSLYSQTIEQDFFDTLKAYEQGMSQTTFNSTEDIQVYFEKPKVMISDSETLDNLKKRNDMGLLLDHEKHMVMNPNLTEEEAIEREALIQEQKKAKQAELMAMMPSEDNDTEESDDDIEDDS